MKILVIHSYYYPDIKGGAEYSLKKLCEGLAMRGHTLVVLCDNPNGNLNETINGVRIYRRKMRCIRSSIMFHMKLLRAATELINPLNWRIISDVLKIERPDIVYTNCLEHISPIAWIVAHRMKIKIVDTQRVYILLEPAGGKYNFGNALWQEVNRRLSRLVDASAFISSYTMEVFVNKGFFSKASHSVIYNSIDFESNDLDKILEYRLNAPIEKPLKFIYLGNLSKHKGVDCLLKAFEKLNRGDAELHIAGEGSLRYLFINRENEGIFFHGWLEETMLNRLLQNTHVLVCPSIWPERVVLDAYKQGMPVIAAKSGGLCETVVDGESGLLVKPGNVEELFDAMCRMTNDKELYLHCCQGAGIKLKEFSLDLYLSKFEHLFRELIPSKNV